MITVIGMVKNAADFIETYIRGNAQVADNFVHLNNMCIDCTIDILDSLSKEGYPIEIIEDNEPVYNQSVKMTKLAKYALVLNIKHQGKLLFLIKYVNCLV